MGTDGWTDRRTDRRTDRWTDGRTYQWTKSHTGAMLAPKKMLVQHCWSFAGPVAPHPPPLVAPHNPLGLIGWPAIGLQSVHDFPSVG
jgi:hypothetical protein